MDETATPYGVIVVIKRDGSDGGRFPLHNERCIFGRGQDCDIRIQLPNVSVEHCEIRVDLVDEKLYLMNMDENSRTLLNGVAVTGREPLSHQDVFTISDRSFRCELPNAVLSPKVGANVISTTTVVKEMKNILISSGVVASPARKVMAVSPSRMIAASPARTAVSPARVPVSPARVAASSAKVAASPARVAVSPARVAASPARVGLSPARVAVSPARIALSPARVAVSPARVAASPARTTTSPARIPLNSAGKFGAVSPARNGASPARVVATVNSTLSTLKMSASPARSVSVSPARITTKAQTPVRNTRPNGVQSSSKQATQQTVAVSPARNFYGLSKQDTQRTLTPSSVKKIINATPMNTPLGVKQTTPASTLKSAGANRSSRKDLASGSKSAVVTPQSIRKVNNVKLTTPASQLKSAGKPRTPAVVEKPRETNVVNVAELKLNTPSSAVKPVAVAEAGSVKQTNITPNRGKRVSSVSSKESLTEMNVVADIKSPSHLGDGDMNRSGSVKSSRATPQSKTKQRKSTGSQINQRDVAVENVVLSAVRGSKTNENVAASGDKRLSKKSRSMSPAQGRKRMSSTGGQENRRTSEIVEKLTSKSPKVEIISDVQANAEASTANLKSMRLSDSVKTPINQKPRKSLSDLTTSSVTNINEKSVTKPGKRRSKSLSPQSARSSGKENKIVSDVMIATESSSVGLIPKLSLSSTEVRQTPVTIMTVVTNSRNSVTPTSAKRKSLADISSSNVFSFGSSSKIKSSNKSQLKVASAERKSNKSNLLSFSLSDSPRASPNSSRTSAFGESFDKGTKSNKKDAGPTPSPRNIKTPPSIPKQRKSLTVTPVGTSSLTAGGSLSGARPRLSVEKSLTGSSGGGMMKKSPGSRRSLEKKSPIMKSTGKKGTPARIMKSITPGRNVKSNVNDSASYTSPNPKSLKLSIGLLRRKSQPVFEMEEAEEGDQVKSPRFGDESRGLKRPAMSPIATSVRKKRNVSFGPSMSPEIFDTTMPACTPLRRGAKATPYRRNSRDSAEDNGKAKPLLKRKSLSTSISSGGSASPLTSTQIPQSPRLSSGSSRKSSTSLMVSKSEKSFVSDLSFVSSISVTSSTGKKLTSPHNKSRLSLDSLQNVSLTSSKEKSPKSGNRRSSSSSPRLSGSKQNSSIDDTSFIISPTQKSNDSLTRPPLRTYGGSQRRSSGDLASPANTSKLSSSSKLMSKSFTSVDTSLVRPPLRRKSSGSINDSGSSPGARSRPRTLSSPASERINSSYADNFIPQKVTSTPRPAQLTSPSSSISKKRKSLDKSPSSTPSSHLVSMTPFSPVVGSQQRSSAKFVADSTARLDASKTGASGDAALNLSWMSSSTKSLKNKSLDTTKNLSRDLYSFDSNPESPPVPRRSSLFNRSTLSSPLNEGGRKSPSFVRLSKTLDYKKLNDNSTSEMVASKSTGKKKRVKGVQNSDMSRLLLSADKETSVSVASSPVTSSKKLNKSQLAATPVQSVTDMNTAAVNKIGSVKVGSGKPRIRQAWDTEPRRVADQKSKVSRKSVGTVSAGKKSVSKKMVSERNIDLSSAAGELKTPSRPNAVAMRAIYGKSPPLDVSPPLSELSSLRKSVKSLKKSVSSARKSVSAVKRSEGRKSDATKLSVQKNKTGKVTKRLTMGGVSGLLAEEKRNKRTSLPANVGNVWEDRFDQLEKRLVKVHDMLDSLMSPNTTRSVLINKTDTKPAKSAASALKKNTSTKKQANVSLSIPVSSTKGGLSTVKKSGKKSEKKKSAVKQKLWSEIVSQKGRASNKKISKASATLQLAKQLKKAKTFKPSKVQATTGLKSGKKAGKGRNVRKPSDKHADAPDTIIIGRVKRVIDSKASVKKTKRQSVKLNESDLPDTPEGPGEMLVSPWVARTSSAKSKKLSVARSLDLTPSATDLSRLHGLVNSPVPHASPLLSGIKRLHKTPKNQPSPALYGIRRLLQTPAAPAISPTFSGIRKLVKTPKPKPSPKLNGVRKMLKTPKVKRSPALNGVRNLVKTPRNQKSPNLAGVKNLVKTPKVGKSPNLAGVRNLVKTPKALASPALDGLVELYHDVSQVATVTKKGEKKTVKTPLTKTPKKIVTPKADVLSTGKKKEVNQSVAKESIASPAPKAKAARGGKGVSTEAVVESVQPAVKSPAPAEKAKGRGRNAVTAKATPVKVAKSPVVSKSKGRGRAADKAVATDEAVHSSPAPAVSKSRSRKAVKSDSVVAATQDDVKSPPKSLPKGRSRKAVVADTVVVASPLITSPVSSGRGRKTGKTITAVVETAKTKTPTPKKRGQKAESVDTTEKLVKSPVPAKVARGRGRKAADVVTVVNTIVEPVKSPGVELPVPSKAARGRGRKTADTIVNSAEESVKSPAVKSPAVVSIKTVRGSVKRKSETSSPLPAKIQKQQGKERVSSSGTSKNSIVNEQNEENKPSAAVSTPAGRKNKTQQAPASVAVSPGPSKRGRASSKGKNVEWANPVMLRTPAAVTEGLNKTPKSSNVKTKGGRKAALPKTSQPVSPKVKRGTKNVVVDKSVVEQKLSEENQSAVAAVASPVRKPSVKTSRKDKIVDVPIAASSTPEQKGRKGRAVAKNANLKSPTKSVVEAVEEKSSAKKGRGSRKVVESAEASVEKSSAGGRGGKKLKVNQEAVAETTSVSTEVLAATPKRARGKQSTANVKSSSKKSNKEVKSPVGKSPVKPSARGGRKPAAKALKEEAQAQKAASPVKSPEKPVARGRGKKGADSDVVPVTSPVVSKRAGTKRTQASTEIVGSPVKQPKTTKKAAAKESIEVKSAESKKKVKSPVKKNVKPSPVRSVRSVRGGKK